MRIAQVAPLHESVPPRAYGGTERVVSYLTEELVDLGHDVTLFASGDSITNARLKPQTKSALRIHGEGRDILACHFMMLERVFAEARNFDIIHFHLDYVHFPMSRRLQHAHVTTLHGRLDLPDLRTLFNEFDEMPVISISESQREPLPEANWRATVNNGIPLNLIEFHPHPGDYLAFIGRISPEKGTHQAIEIARRCGMKLKIAAKVDKIDVEYFETTIKPLLREPSVEFIGEINDTEKNEFLGNAYATLFPIDWPEPFGLAMIESMASGTPVIAWARGAVPEIMQHRKTGFIVSSIDEAVRAFDHIGEIDRAICRRAFEERFTAERMAREYVAVYEHILNDEATAQQWRGALGRRAWKI